VCYFMALIYCVVEQLLSPPPEWLCFFRLWFVSAFWDEITQNSVLLVQLLTVGSLAFLYIVENKNILSAIYS